jgi:hypothetical protein
VHQVGFIIKIKNVVWADALRLRRTALGKCKHASAVLIAYTLRCKISLRCLSTCVDCRGDIF